MKESMSREHARRYAEAVYYAVVGRDLSFALADEFAHHWAEHGWLVHRRIENGFANWAAQMFPRAVDDEE